MSPPWLAFRGGKDLKVVGVGARPGNQLTSARKRKRKKWKLSKVSSAAAPGRSEAARRRAKAPRARARVKEPSQTARSSQALLPE